MIEVTKEIYRESKTIKNGVGGVSMDLHIQGHLMLVQRADMGTRLHLLVTTSGVIISDKQDDAGDRVYASFEATTLLEPRTEMQVPRLCVFAADQWFAEGPEKMREILAAKEAES